MPRVPSRDNQQVFVGPARVSVTGSNRFTDAFAAHGGVAARALRRAGQAGQRAGLNEITTATRKAADENEAERRDMESQYIQQVNTLLYGDDNQPGLYNLKGKEALRHQSTAYESLRKIRDNIASNANREISANLFDDFASRREAQTTGQLNTFFQNESRNYNLQTAKVRVAESMQDAALSGGDPNILAESKLAIAEAIETQAEIEGWSKEVKESAYEAARTGMHQSVLNTMIARKQYGDANAYFQQFSSEMDGPERVKMEQSLRDLTEVDRVDAVVDDLRRRFPDDPEAQLAAARDEQSGSFQQKVTETVRQRFQEQTWAENRFRNNSQFEAQKVASEGGAQDLLAWGAQNPDKQEALQELGVWQSYLDTAENNLLDQGFARVSDPRVKTYLNTLDDEEMMNLINQSGGNIPEFLEAYRVSLDRADWLSLGGKVQGAVARQNELSQQDRPYTMGMEEVNLAFSSVSQDDLTNAQKQLQVQAEVDEWIQGQLEAFKNGERTTRVGRDEIKAKVQEAMGGFQGRVNQPDLVNQFQDLPLSTRAYGDLAQMGPLSTSDLNKVREIQRNALNEVQTRYNNKEAWNAVYGQVFKLLPKELGLDREKTDIDTNRTRSRAKGLMVPYLDQWQRAWSEDERAPAVDNPDHVEFLSQLLSANLWDRNRTLFGSRRATSDKYEPQVKPSGVVEVTSDIRNAYVEFEEIPRSMVDQIRATFQHNNIEPPRKAIEHYYAYMAINNVEGMNVLLGQTDGIPSRIQNKYWELVGDTDIDGNYRSANQWPRVQ